MKTEKQLNYYECINPLNICIDIGCIGDIEIIDIRNNTPNDIREILKEKYAINLVWCKDFDSIVKQLKELYTGEDMDVDIWYEDEITVQTIYNTIILLNGGVYTYSFVSCLDRDVFVSEINKKDKHIKTFLGTSFRTSDKKLISSMDEVFEEVQNLLLKK